MVDGEVLAVEEETVREAEARKKARQMKRAVQIGRTLAHPMRIEILELVGKHPKLAPADISRMGVGSLSNVNYHVVEATKIGCLRMVDTEPSGGTTRHIYSLTPLGQSVLTLLAEL